MTGMRFQLCFDFKSDRKTTIICLKKRNSFCVHISLNNFQISFFLSFHSMSSSFYNFEEDLTVPSWVFLRYRNSSSDNNLNVIRDLDVLIISGFFFLVLIFWETTLWELDSTSLGVCNQHKNKISKELEKV